MVDIVSKVTLDVYPSEWFHIYTSQEYDRARINVNVSQELVDSINWLKKYKAQLEEEAKIRSENPAAAYAYESYQAMLKLVKDGSNQT